MVQIDVPINTPVAAPARRPIADVWRRTANAATRWCVGAGVNPNAISCASVVLSAGAAICFAAALRAPALLLLAPVLCLSRLWLNMLDGMVAVAAGKASRRGEVFNELPDRVSDVLIFVGVAHSGLAAPLLGYWAAILALLTAYVGTLGQAVAGRREFGGVMSKQWRMFAFAPAAGGAAVALTFGAGDEPLRLAQVCMNGVLVLIVAGCVQTVVVRVAATMRRITETEGTDR